MKKKQILIIPVLIIAMFATGCSNVSKNFKAAESNPTESTDQTIMVYDPTGKVEVESNSNSVTFDLGGKGTIVCNAVVSGE